MIVSSTTPIKLYLFLSLPLCRRSILLTGGGAVGEEPSYTTERKPGPLKIIQYSLRVPVSSKVALVPQCVSNLREALAVIVFAPTVEKLADEETRQDVVIKQLTVDREGFGRRKCSSSRLSHCNLPLKGQQRRDQEIYA